ncbi:MAG: TRAP transporter large permease subunit [Halieaceae bacterium]
MPVDNYTSLYMFLCVCLALMLGYPVAYTLAGTALIFAAGGVVLGNFDAAFLSALPGRLYGTITNITLIAVPLFIMMGVVLEKSRIAEELLDNMSRVFAGLRGGLGISVVVVGALLAASTGIVGATVVTMGLLSLPTMMKRGYQPALAAGTICATGTLGQIIPPSIALVLLGDILSSAYQQAQLSMNIFNPKTVSVGDLFMGALLPGLLLVALYIAYISAYAWLRPEHAPAVPDHERVDAGALLRGLLPPMLLITAVLGSILSGAATPTEAAGVGAIGALLLAIGKRQMTLGRLREVVIGTTEVTSMVFMILIGAALFSLVFRGFGGEELIRHYFENMPGGVMGATLVVMVVIFLLGFILDFIEITFVVVPIVGPILLAMGLDPVWLGIMIAINLQTSFLTPPFGFALFYLRGVAPAELATSAIYRGVIPFILIQLLVLGMLVAWPGLATWLPQLLKQ